MAKDWHPAIRALIYCVQFEDDPTRAVDHALQSVVAKGALGLERNEIPRSHRERTVEHGTAGKGDPSSTLRGEHPPISRAAARAALSVSRQLRAERRHQLRPNMRMPRRRCRRIRRPPRRRTERAVPLRRIGRQVAIRPTARRSRPLAPRRRRSGRDAPRPHQAGELAEAAEGAGSLRGFRSRRGARALRRSGRRGR